jgi:hypothetical protein
MVQPVPLRAPAESGVRLLRGNVAVKEPIPSSVTHKQALSWIGSPTRVALVIILAALGAVGFVVLALQGFFLYSAAASESERAISGPVIISSNWVEITPQEPLTVSQRTQSVLLVVADRYTPYRDPFRPEDPSWDRSWAMRFPDGTLVRPEVQLVDEYGNIYDLMAPSFIDKDRGRGDERGGMGFSTRFDERIDSNLPRDRVYRTVRVRSPRPVHCSKVIWYCRTGK